MLVTLTEINEIASALAVEAAPSSNPNTKTHTKILGAVTVMTGFPFVFRNWALELGFGQGAEVTSRKLVGLLSFLTT